MQQFKDWHRPRLAILSRAEPDLIAFETIPSQKEAEALAELLKEFPNVKGWLSFNCQVVNILVKTIMKGENSIRNFLKEKFSPSFNCITVF